MTVSDNLNENTDELRQSLEHMDWRATGSIALQELLEELDNLPNLDRRDKNNRETYVRLRVSLSHALYA